MTYDEIAERLDPPEVNRTCPVCGKDEPVSANVILWAKENGLADVWLCWSCFIEQEKAMPRKLI